MDTSSQGQLDDKMLRYISENAEVEYVLLTPFRWLIGAGKLIIYTLLLTLWFTFTLFGWVFNVGEYSLENRREAVCDARAYFHFCDPTSSIRRIRTTTTCGISAGSFRMAP